MGKNYWQQPPCGSANQSVTDSGKKSLQMQNAEKTLSEFIEIEDSLYHFTNRNTAIEYILNDGRLKPGLLCQTGDPQEYKSKMTMSCGYEINDNQRCRVALIRKLIDSNINSSSSLSFCQNRYNNNCIQELGCLKSRMWSQYGENHSGICLVFSKKMILSKIKEIESDSLTIFKRQVSYRDYCKGDQLGNLLLVNGIDLTSQDNKEIINDYIKKAQESIFFTKQNDYEDENEFRIIFFTSNDENKTDIFFDILKSLKIIILGDAFPKVYLPTIHELAKSLNTPYLRLQWEKHTYKLLK